MALNWQLSSTKVTFDRQHNTETALTLRSSTTGIKCSLLIHFGEQLVWFYGTKKKGSGTSLTLGMCSGVQWRGGGGTGHYRLLRAHAGPRGRWRQTGQPPHKASNQSAPIHCRWHQDPTGRMGVGDQGEESLGVRSAQSRLPVDRTRVNSNSSRLSCQRNSTEPSERCSNSNG